MNQKLPIPQILIGKGDTAERIEKLNAWWDKLGLLVQIVLYARLYADPTVIELPFWQRLQALPAVFLRQWAAGTTAFSFWRAFIYAFVWTKFFIFDASKKNLTTK